MVNSNAIIFNKKTNTISRILTNLTNNCYAIQILYISSNRLESLGLGTKFCNVGDTTFIHYNEEDHVIFGEDCNLELIKALYGADNDLERVLPARPDKL